MTANRLFSQWALGGASGLGATIGACPPAWAESSSAGMTLSEADRLAVFKAAGAVQKKGMWLLCADEPNPGGATIGNVRDLNGDGRPEAVVTEGGTFCYGRAEAEYALLSKQADGSWRVMTGGSGKPEFLQARGAGKWPDIPISGPGFCFPVQRWNGKTYELNRFEHEGKRCKPLG